MLDLGVDVAITVKKVRYPIHFEKKNICVHCASQGSLVFVDKFGNESKKEINAFDHIKCKSCGRIYSILWQHDEDDKNKMYPCAVDPSIKRQFINLVNSSSIKKKGIKELE